MNSITKLSSKGQIVLPKDVRDALGWPKGQILTVQRTSSGVLITPPEPKRERISWEEFRRRVPKYNGPPIAIEDMKTRIGDLFRNQDNH
jgi:AbrB family looped-hinge helix DNA binding protein